MSNTIRVPVQNPDGSAAMPTKSSRARRWVQQGKAIEVRNDLEVYGVRLVSEPSGRTTQEIALGIDPGKLFTGIGVQSAKATLFKAHLQLPFKSVTKKMTTRRILRRARRGRRINRKLPYNHRCHRQKRFDNRSVYDINWHRIGQFSPSKVQLIKRSTRLLSYVQIC